MGVQSGKLIRCIAATTLYIGWLLGLYVAHVHFVPVNVVLYGALIDAFLAVLLTLTTIWVLPWFAPLNLLERGLLVTIWLLGGYAFAISVPTVIDRSLSFYILEKLNQRGGAINESALEGIITTEFMQEYRVTDARITEQLESGTIQISNGCIRLTDKGKAIAAFSSFFRHNLLPRKRLLRDQYSDELTQPFRRSPEHVDYRCP